MMRILLDTHILLWFIEGNERLSQKIKSIIEDLDNDRFTSVVSLWEIVLKTNLGKLELKKSLEEFIESLADNDIQIIGLETHHLKDLVGLPFHHRDPFDRTLIAQAISENMTLISIDDKFKAYPVDIIW